jgi:hypothetical protein
MNAETPKSIATMRAPQSRQTQGGWLLTGLERRVHGRHLRIVETYA